MFFTAKFMILFGKKMLKITKMFSKKKSIDDARNVKKSTYPALERILYGSSEIGAPVMEGNQLMGDPDVTANPYCSFAYPY